MENTTAAPDSTTPNAMDDAPLLFVQQPTMSSMALSPATSLAFDPSYQAQPLADPPVPTPQHHAQSLDAIIGQHRHLHRRHSSDASTYRTNSSAPHSRSGSFVEGSDATHTHSRCSTQSGQPLSARRHNPYTPVLSPHGPIGGNDPHTPSNRPPSRHLTTEGGLLNLSPHDIATRNSEHGTPSGPSTPAVLASVGFKDMHASSLSASSHSVTWHSRQPSLSAPPLAPPVAPPQYGDLYSGQAPPVPHPASFPWTHQHESNSSTLPPLPYGIPYHHHLHHHHHHHHNHHHHHFHGFGPHPGPYGMGVSPMFQPHHHHRHYHQHMAFTHQHHFDPTAANVVVPPGESPAMTAPHTRRGKRGGRSKRGGAGYVGPDATHHKRTRRGCRAGQRVKEREAMGAAAAVGPEGQTIPADADDDGVSDTSSSSSNDDS